MHLSAFWTPVGPKSWREQNILQILDSQKLGGTGPHGDCAYERRYCRLSSPRRSDVHRRCKKLGIKMFKNVTKTLTLLSLGVIEGQLRTSFNSVHHCYTDRMFSLCTVLNVIEKQKSNTANNAKRHSKWFLVTLLLTIFIIYEISYAKLKE